MRCGVRNVKPILAVSDVQGTLDWYVSALGATFPWAFGEPPQHAGCTLGSAGVCFTLDDALCIAMAGFQLGVEVSDIEGYRQELAALGTSVASELEAKPWGALEFTVEDPNGVQLRFTESGRVPEQGNEIEVRLVARQLSAAENKSLTVSVGWDSADSDKDGSYHPRLYTVVAEYEDEVVGAASVTGNGVDTFYVKDVMVRPEFQGRGVGSQMMRELLDWIEREVPKNHHVTLLTGSATTRFYERFGFLGPDTGYVGMYLRT